MTDRPGISLDAWYPLVEPIAHTPRTAIVRASLDLAPIAYAGDSADDPEVRAALEALGSTVDALRIVAEPLGYPLFLRSGLTSGKHDWVNTCLVADPSDIPDHVEAIIAYSAMVDFFGLACDVWVVRELLPTRAAFVAFEGMPITRERRYFVEDGKLLGWQPYWPPDAFENQEGLPDDWRARLDELNRPTDDNEVPYLTDASLAVSRAVPGAWSVDWLWSGDRWYLTDMAWAERSFVWDECPTAPRGLGE